METMIAPNLPAQAARPSHAADPAATTTRPSLSPTTRTSLHHTALTHDQHLRAAAPLSQESVFSTQSTDSSVGSRLQQSSSNVSQLSQYTDLTWPSVTTAPRDMHATERDRKMDFARVRTPENTSQPADFALASPMSLTSPVSVNGAKRTASGHVKTPSIPHAPSTAMHSSRARGESMSSTGSRAGELAANLKTRLGYAMAKVQNGWEHRNFAEVEQLAAHKARQSMSHVDYSTRPLSAGLSNGTSRLSVHEQRAQHVPDRPFSPPSKRRSGHYASYPSEHAMSSAPRLQPAPEIRAMNGSRPYHSSRPSSGHVHSYVNSNHGNAMSPPRTPINGQPRRPPILRTETQTAQAERDALDALFQLGSPHVSQGSQRPFASQANSSQASPVRAEFPTPRRVTFARSDSGQSTASSSAASASAVHAARQAALEGLEALSR